MPEPQSRGRFGAHRTPNLTTELTRDRRLAGLGSVRPPIRHATVAPVYCVRLGVSLQSAEGSQEANIPSQERIYLPRRLFRCGFAMCLSAVAGCEWLSPAADWRCAYPRLRAASGVVGGVPPPLLAAWWVRQDHEGQGGDEQGEDEPPDESGPHGPQTPSSLSRRDSSPRERYSGLLFDSASRIGKAKRVPAGNSVPGQRLPIVTPFPHQLPEPGMLSDPIQKEVAFQKRRGDPRWKG
jgi:hypothetical protein